MSLRERGLFPLCFEGGLGRQQGVGSYLVPCRAKFVAVDYTSRSYTMARQHELALITNDEERALRGVFISY